MAGKTRHATEADVRELANIYAETLLDAYDGLQFASGAITDDRTVRTRRFRDAILSGSRLWLVADSEDGIAGFCGLIPARDPTLPSGYGEIPTIAVLRLHRRQGYGRALLTVAAEEALARGWTALVLWVVDTNFKARSFYESCGFHPDGATRVDVRLGFDAPTLRYRRALV